ncbi:unnamed protein product [Choristocarpus tenellus]
MSFIFSALSSSSGDLCGVNKIGGMEVVAEAGGNKSMGTMERLQGGMGSCSVQGASNTGSFCDSTRATVVLSDMAPSFSGDRGTDQARTAALFLDALALCLGEGRRHNLNTSTAAVANGKRERREKFNADEQGEEGDGGLGDGWGVGLLARGGSFLGKFLAGGEEASIRRKATRLFSKVKIVKPKASRSESTEMYLLCTGFLLPRTSVR